MELFSVTDSELNNVSLHKPHAWMTSQDEEVKLAISVCIHVCRCVYITYSICVCMYIYGMAATLGWYSTTWSL